MGNPNPYAIRMGGIHYPHPTTLVACQYCGVEMDGDSITTILNPVTANVLFRGCWGCLQRMLTPRQSIDYATRLLLQRAYNALTMPMSHADIGEVADALERVLKGS